MCQFLFVVDVLHRSGFVVFVGGGVIPWRVSLRARSPFMTGNCVCVVEAAATVAVQGVRLGPGGSSMEVCKNLVLAGVSVTVRDHRVVQATDVAFNYFLRTVDVGKNSTGCARRRVQEMNSSPAGAIAHNQE